MTTLWEMAETIRAEQRAEECGTQAVLAQAAKPQHRPRDYRDRDYDYCGRDYCGSERSIDIRTRDRLAYWCKFLGATPMQLHRAIAHVGQDPSAIRRFLVGRLSPGRVRARRARSTLARV